MVRTSVPIPANEAPRGQKKDGVVRSSLELVFSCESIHDNKIFHHASYHVLSPLIPFCLASFLLSTLGP